MPNSHPKAAAGMAHKLPYLMLQSVIYVSYSPNVGVDGI